MNVLRHFFRKSPDTVSATALLDRGLVRFREGKQKIAIADFGKAIRYDPNNAYAWYVRGIAYVTLGEYSKGEADRDVAVRLNPDGAANYHYEFANAYSEVGEYDKAIAEFDRAIFLNPDLSEAYHNRGVTNTRRRELDHAIADFDKALELSPHDCEIYAGRGSAYSAKGEYGNAIADFTRALQIDTDYHAAYTLRADAHQRRGDVAFAVEDLTRAINLAPEIVENYTDRAQLHTDTGLVDEAIADLDKAIELNPKNPVALLMRGDSHARQWEEAFESNLSVYDLQRRMSGQHEADSMWHIFHILTYDRAIEDYQNASRIYPNNKELIHFTNIVVEATQAIKNNPREGHAYHSRASAYRVFRQGTLDLAIANYTQSIDIAWRWISRNSATIMDGQHQYPYLASSYQSRGKSFAELGEWDKARVDFDMANRLAGIAIPV